MALTRAAGNDGGITMPAGTHDAITQAWNLSIPVVTADVTDYADTVQNNRGGIIQPSGSITAVPKFDAASTSPGVADRVANGSALTLQQAAACTYAFAAALFNRFDFSSVKQGAAGITFGFVNGVGSFTETWDETG